jgi:hypothetical protein
VIRRFLRDPLLHFLVAGAALFALYAWIGSDTGERPDRIVVSEQRVESLAATFARTWMRPPTEDELRGLVDDYVIEEILYRKALALGLDRDDLIVRRRMRQKMEFLTAELDAAEPTEEELAAFLREHPDRFALPARLSFTQVYVDPERSETAPETRAAALLQRLRGDGLGAVDPASLGDATLLPPVLEEVTAREVADRFGVAFSEALLAAPVGAWHGPVESAFGLHLVRVQARVPSRASALDQVREEVARELAAEHRARTQERFVRSLREGYEIELPAALAGSAAAPSGR